MRDFLDDRELVLYCADQWTEMLMINVTESDETMSGAMVNASSTEVNLGCIDPDREFANCSEVYSEGLWNCEEWPVVKLLIIIMVLGIIANSLVFYVSFKHSNKVTKITPSTFFVLR